MKMGFPTINRHRHSRESGNPAALWDARYGKNLQTPLGPRCSLPSNALVEGEGDKFLALVYRNGAWILRAEDVKSLRLYGKFNIDPIAVRISF